MIACFLIWIWLLLCFVLVFFFCQPVLYFPLMEAFPVMLLLSEEASLFLEDM